MAFWFMKRHPVTAHCTSSSHY